MPSERKRGTGRAKVVRFDTQFHAWGESIFWGLPPPYSGGEELPAPCLGRLA